ncbi:MAG: PHP domain-containing protein [Candidatus Latescibacterota bacterium]|nr:PHP domain-containing protein [Candidatus Latescibacterota bacterium]
MVDALAPLGPGAPAPTALKLATLERVDKVNVLDYHLHTDYTDGMASVDAMARAAAERGVAEMLYSEHVRHTSTYFPGFAQRVRALSVPGLIAFVGVEAKVLDVEGHLDVSPQTAELCDAIVGSVHSPPPGSGPPGWSYRDPREALQLELELALAIVTRSRAHILGHPLGMVVAKYGLNPLDELAIIAEACRDYGKAFELNPRYCQASVDWYRIAAEAGCMVNFGSDAHRTDDVASAWTVFAAEGGGW